MRQLFSVHPFDIAIVGGGLSGLIQADYLSEDPDPNLKILIIDPDPSKMTHKTFASWARKSDPPHRYSHLVSHRWQKIHLTGTQGERLECPLQQHTYEVISGERLFLHLHEKIARDARFTWSRTSVISISESGSQNRISLHLSSGEVVTANQMLSSVVNSTSNLYQSFVGIEIQTQEPFFDPSSVHLMDFSFPQNSEVRFVYTLPFSEKHALIEYTAFSKQRPEQADLNDRLMELVYKNFKTASYQVLRKESGAIPMDSTLEPLFPPSFSFSGIKSLGSAASRIKPSTGYSFSRNLDSFSKQKGSLLRTARFAFYDNLLLSVVKKMGGKAHTVFFQLFRNNPVDAVLFFLSEQTSFWEEVKIFLRLPLMPFLTQVPASHPFFFIVTLTLIFRFLDLSWAMWTFPLVGLLTLGVAHGSLDIALSQTERRLSFIGSYLARILICVVLWTYAPFLAFVLFISQASDHFGEAEWIRLLRVSDSARGVRVRTWLWGLFASFFGVLYHWDESLPFIHALLGQSNPLSEMTFERARVAAFVLMGISLWATRSLERYHSRVYGKPGDGFIRTIGLGFSLMALPLLPGFFCFLAFWHGWDTLKVQLNTKKMSLKKYIAQATPYTLITYSMILFLLGALKSSLTPSILTQIFVVAISGLTAAHAPAMKRFLFGRGGRAPHGSTSPGSRSKKL